MPLPGLAVDFKPSRGTLLPMSISPAFVEHPVILQRTILLAPAKFTAFLKSVKVWQRAGICKLGRFLPTDTGVLSLAQLGTVRRPVSGGSIVSMATKPKPSPVGQAVQLITEIGARVLVVARQRGDVLANMGSLVFDVETKKPANKVTIAAITRDKHEKIGTLNIKKLTPAASRRVAKKVGPVGLDRKKIHQAMEAACAL